MANGKEAENKREPITDDVLQGICAEFLRTALGAPDSEVSDLRQRNLEAYNADPEGDFAPPEVADRSDFVATDVADTVDGMLPQLMRYFVSSDDAVECKAKKQGAEGMAKSATAYLNHLFYVRNDGLNVLYDWFKDALVQKVGHVMVWAEEEFEDSRQTYEGLTEEQAAAVLYSPDCELVGQPEQDESGIRLTVKHEGKRIAIKVAAVPPHEMRIDPGAKWGDEPVAIGRAYARRKFELEEEGIDCSNVSEYSYRSYAEQLEQLGEADDDTYEEIHDSHRLVECADIYLKLDRDGDGVAEWLRVRMLGDSIAIKNGEPDVEQTDDHPFAEICPMPRPHSYFGDCPADRAYQPQKQRTNLMRALLDNVYYTTNPRTYVNINAGVNVDDMLESRPGGLVRGTASPGDAFAPMVTPNMGQAAWQLNEWMESWRESRTLFNRYSAGTDQNALNKTKGGVELLTAKADMGLELMARFFAQGVRKMFAKMLKLATKHQSQEDWFSVNGEWVAVNPTEWRDQFNLEINVGLGQGTKEQQLQRIMAMVPLQQMGLQVGVVEPQHIANTIRSAAVANEFKNPDEFASAEPPQGPNPQQVQQMQQQLQELGQRSQQLEQENAHLKMEKEGAQLELKRERIRSDIEKANSAFDAREQHFGAQVRDAQYQSEMGEKDGDAARLSALEQQMAMIGSLLSQLLPQQSPMDGDMGMDAPAAPLQGA